MELKKGTYTIPSNLKAKVKGGNTIIVSERTGRFPISPDDKRCKDCVYMKLGRLSIIDQYWDSYYCSMRPKRKAPDGTQLYYSVQANRFACLKFKEKTDDTTTKETVQETKAV